MTSGRAFGRTALLSTTPVAFAYDRTAIMGEGIVALLLLVVVAATAWLGPGGLLALGLLLTAIGLLAALVVGVVYHLRLRAAVLRRGALPSGWWWAPSRLHPLLDEAGQAHVLPVFRAGVAVVSVAVAGLLFIALAAAKAYLLGR